MAPPADDSVVDRERRACQLRYWPPVQDSIRKFLMRCCAFIRPALAAFAGLARSAVALRFARHVHKDVRKASCSSRITRSYDTLRSRERSRAVGVPIRFDIKCRRRAFRLRARKLLVRAHGAGRFGTVPRQALEAEAPHTSSKRQGHSVGHGSAGIRRTGPVVGWNCRIGKA
jgi:hypothetical protein